MLKLAAAAAVAAVALAAVPAAHTSSVGTISQCASLKGHVYEACFAYIINDSALALRGYYHFVNGSDPIDALDATEAFEYRYRGQAYRLIERRVANWPPGDRVALLPYITVLNAQASLVTNTAQLTTRESWLVTTASGKVLFREIDQLHQITMARVKGNHLHIWVVTSIR